MENQNDQRNGQAVVHAPHEDDLGNACAGFAPEDIETLREIAASLSTGRNLALRLGSFMGDQAEGLATAAGRLVFNNSRFSARAIAEASLRRLHDAAITGLDLAAMDEPAAVLRAGRRHRLITTLSGAATGFLGAPGMVIDIPLTTGLMLRSIAGIARSYGEDPNSEEGRRACLEVFALGTDGVPTADGQANYWAARAALSRLAIDGFLRRVGGVLGVAFAQRLMTRIVPLVGAAAGGAMNYAFMEHYQSMARIHFALRALERRYEPEAVRACLDRLIAQIRRPLEPLPEHAPRIEAPVG